MAISKINIIISILFILLLKTGSNAAISESTIEKYGSDFTKKIISDNGEYKESIYESLNGIIRGDNSGIKLIDKIALFIYDSKKNGMNISKTRYFSNHNVFYIFIVFKDSKNESYTLYLEYKFNRKKKVCELEDVYFSLVFDEKMEQITNFFKYR